LEDRDVADLDAGRHAGKATAPAWAPRGSLSLPAQLTRLFGREAERTQLEDVLAHTRLVTVTGAPGCGKSRLSLELGSQLAPRFRDGHGSPSWRRWPTRR
jgi:hypothetical protein